MGQHLAELTFTLYCRLRVGGIHAARQWLGFWSSENHQSRQKLPERELGANDTQSHRAVARCFNTHPKVVPVAEFYLIDMIFRRHVRI